MRKTKDFDISKYPEVDVQSFTLQVMNGQDSLDATARAVGSDGKPNPMIAMKARSELISDSIVKVNGQEVPFKPYTEWENWSLRTQTFVERAFDKLNSVTQDEMDDFLGRHGLIPKKTPEAT